MGLPMFGPILYRRLGWIEGEVHLCDVNVCQVQVESVSA
jgi:hypothetical protein